MAHLLAADTVAPRLLLGVTLDGIRLAASELAVYYKDDIEGFKAALDELIRKTMPNVELPHLPIRAPLPQLRAFALDTNSLDCALVMNMTRYGISFLFVDNVAQYI